jgi:hypothetical protein
LFIGVKRHYKYVNRLFLTWKYAVTIWPAPK